MKAIGFRGLDLPLWCLLLFLLPLLLYILICGWAFYTYYPW